MRPPLPVSGRGRGLRGQSRDLLHRHARAGRGSAAQMGPGHGQPIAAAHRSESAVPGSRPRRRRVEGGGQGARHAADPDLDARIRQCAHAHGHQCHYEGPGNRRSESRHLSRGPQGARPLRDPHGHPHRRRGRLPALPQTPETRRQDDAVRDRARCAALRRVRRADEAAARPGRNRGGRRRCRRADQCRARTHGGPAGARRGGDRDRGVDRYRVSRARRVRSANRTATLRSRNSTCRCA